MNKKGFTLIELLAVIIILAIIALIAVPQILGVIEKSRKGAAEVSALGYVEAVEKYMIMHDIDSNKYPYDLKNNTWNVSDSTNVAFLDLFVEKVNAEGTVPALNTFIDVKGTKPASGTITTNNKEVISASLVMNGYNVECLGESCNVGGKSEAPTPTPTPVVTTNSVVITKNNVDAGSSIEITEGDSITLGALVTLSNNETTNNVSWTKVGESINISSSGVVTTNSVGQSTVTATYDDKSDSVTINVISACSLSQNEVVFSETYTTNSPYTFTVPCDGNYKVELWGAQGSYYNIGNNSSYIGKGAYVSGNISLLKNRNMYIYIGGHSHDSNNYYLSVFNNLSVAYKNNSNHYSSSGGGATDIRLVNGDWNNENSLRSRIMVAGAGGGNVYNSESNYSFGGNAGGLTSYNGHYNENLVNRDVSSCITYGSNQNSTGTIMSSSSCTGLSSGQFGIGGNGCTEGTSPLGGGGGAGWYGGSGSGHNSGVCGGGGAGGSSYISGHTGCVAVTSKTNTTPKSGCTTGTTDRTCSISPYEYEFTNTKMIDGAGYSWTNTKGSLEAMPNPTGGYYASGVGHTGNGYAKITYLGN